MPRKKKEPGIDEQLESLISRAIREKNFLLANKLLNVLQNRSLTEKDLEDAQDATSETGL